MNYSNMRNMVGWIRRVCLLCSASFGWTCFTCSVPSECLSHLTWHTKQVTGSAIFRIQLQPCVMESYDDASFLSPSITQNQTQNDSSSCISVDIRTDLSMPEPPDLHDEPRPARLRPPCCCHGQTPILKRQDSHPPLDVTQHSGRVTITDKHKTSLKNKYQSLYEGIKVEENQTLLKSIYTQLYIIEGESERVNEEHEVLHMEKTYKTPRDAPINCNDIFNSLPEAGCERNREETNDKIKSVLTKGIAGIGKTVSVQKFILDWAEGTANQDVDFMFVLPFRELNLIKDDQYSLHELLLDFHPELQDLDSKIYEECKVVFIFDGLDENRMTLMFTDGEKVSDVTKTLSVSVLMSNLIRGDLLPSALIWITSRPAAANQIPSKYIQRLTEIQGFNDAQKEEYFRKRISDERQADRIISHIRRARSLHIMCHIPVFCWISSTVLQNILKEDNERAEIPQTLTEMYIHFLLVQINMRNQKFNTDEKEPKKLLQTNRDVIMKLSEVAYKQLMKGNVIFYENDLKDCGINITAASLYSGICNEIFKEDCVICQKKVYSFIHRSFQEFLAAFYKFSVHINRRDLLNAFLVQRGLLKNKPLEKLLIESIDESMKNKTGHLDLFLRFLLGISLESNQRLLGDLLTHTVNSSESVKIIAKYIKEKINSVEDLSTDRSINLFLCLLEVNDQTLYREIHEFVKSDKHLEKRLSPAHCSAIAYMLQMSEEVMEELDLMKYNTSDEGRRRLVPALINCISARLPDCKLDNECCKVIASALLTSLLRELDVSNNDLQDSGVKLISDALRSHNCQLQTLRLSMCNLTAECCESLASSLQSSGLRELDVSNNDLQDSGVKLISDALRSHNCQLQTLRLSMCNLTAECCESLASSLQSSGLRELDVSNNDLQDSGVKLISDALRSHNCQLQTLRLSMCNLTAECCESLASSLQSSGLRELDVSNNDLQDSGVKLISDALRSHNCQLQTLGLSGCMVTEKGCCYLASALKSNPSHLTELDLSYNHPSPSGVQLLKDLLNDPNYKLNQLDVNYGSESMKTAGLHKYACVLTLDPNTANPHLVLSEDNRKVTFVEEPQSCPDHAERFDFHKQVLCRETLSGRCYWEVELELDADVVISVAYEGIHRKRRKCDGVFELDEKCWSLCCSKNKLSVCHKDLCRSICELCERIGVYVDWWAGTLSFYHVSDTHTLTHLHTFCSTFSEKLRAGFVVYEGSLSLCQIKPPQDQI